MTWYLVVQTLVLVLHYGISVELPFFVLWFPTIILVIEFFKNYIVYSMVFSSNDAEKEIKNILKKKE